MASAARDVTPLLDWAVATLPLVGQAESGDMHLVRPVRDGALVAVVDGLGHGEEAAVAARLAITTIDKLAEDSPLDIITRCHAALKGTRGAVLSLARFDQRRATLTWVGVGNVEGVLHHADWAERSARASLIARGGIVGSALPPVQPAVVPVRPGDTLVFATDGLRTGFADDISAREPPQRLADLLLERYGKGTDDALALVARVRAVS